MGGRKEKDRKGEVQRAGMRDKKHPTEATAIEKLQKKLKLMVDLLCFRTSVIHLSSSSVSVFIPSIDCTNTHFVFICLYVCVCVISVRARSCMCVWEAGCESEALPPTQVGVVEAPEPRLQQTPMFADVCRNV